MDAATQQGFAHGLVVGNVFTGNGRLTVHLVCTGVVDGDFSGEVLGLEDDGGREVRQRATVGHLPLGFHGLGAFAEQGMVALAADQGEVLVTASLFVDDVRQLFFGGLEFFACLHPLGFQ